MQVHSYSSLIQRLQEGCEQAGLRCLITPTMDGTLCHISVGAGVLAEIALHDAQRRPLQSFTIRWSLTDKRHRLHHEVPAFGHVDPFNGGRAVAPGLDVEQVLASLQQAAKAAQAGKATLGLSWAVPLRVVKACLHGWSPAQESAGSLPQDTPARSTGTS